MLNAANSIAYSGQATFKTKALSPYTVNGVHAGDFKNVGNLSFLKVFGAGHEVPYYRKFSFSTSLGTMERLHLCDPAPSELAYEHPGKL